MWKVGWTGYSGLSLLFSTWQTPMHPLKPTRGGPSVGWSCGCRSPLLSSSLVSRHPPTIPSHQQQLPLASQGP
jgi:hypothetical protein